MDEETKRLREAIAKVKSEMVTEEEARKIIVGVIKKNMSLINSKGEHSTNALMGEAMRELRGKINGDSVSRILMEELEKIVEKSLE